MIFMGHFEHQTQTKMNFIGPLETRRHIQKLLECLDRPENYVFVYFSAWESYEVNKHINFDEFCYFQTAQNVNLEQATQCCALYGFLAELSLNFGPKTVKVFSKYVVLLFSFLYFGLCDI